MADTLSASSGIGGNEATEALASVVSEASVQAVSTVPFLLEKFRQRIANVTRSKVVPLAMALGLTMAPACTDKPVQESFVNLNSGIPDATLSKPADTAAIAPVSQSPAQGDNLKIPANVIAQFNASATTPVAETTPAVTEAPAITPAQPPTWAKGLSGRTARSVLALSQFIQNKQAKGEILPSETVDIVSVTPVTPDGVGLDQLVNTGSKLPKLTFKEVTGYDELTLENYAQVFEKLFDTSDIEVWLTRSDGSPMSKLELQDYRDDMADTKDRWMKQIASMDESEKREWFDTFNKTEPIYDAREIRRRMIINLHAMISAKKEYPTLSGDQLKDFDPNLYTMRKAVRKLRRDPGVSDDEFRGQIYDAIQAVAQDIQAITPQVDMSNAPNAEKKPAIDPNDAGISESIRLALAEPANTIPFRKSPKERLQEAVDIEKALASSLTTQLGELGLMTNPNIREVKITQKYTDNGTVLKYLVPSDQALHESLHFPGGVQMVQVALTGWNEQQAKRYAVYRETTALKSETTALKSKGATLDKFGTLISQSTALVDKILKQYQQLPQNRENTAFIKELHEDLQTYVKITKQLQTMADNDPKREIVPQDSRDTTKELLSTIKELSEANKFPFPTT